MIQSSDAAPERVKISPQLTIVTEHPVPAQQSDEATEHLKTTQTQDEAV